MARPRAEINWHAVLVAGFALGALNYLTVYFWNYPFLYCWLGPVVWPLYLAWANLANVGMLVVFLYHLAKQNGQGMLATGLVYVVITYFPGVVVSMFRLGGSCG